MGDFRWGTSGGGFQVGDWGTSGGGLQVRDWISIHFVLREKGNLLCKQNGKKKKIHHIHVKACIGLAPN